VTLLGGIFDAARGQGSTPAAIVPQDEFVKPVILPPPGSTDLVEHVRAENLFWTDVLREHAQFFVLLMPGPELIVQRAQAKRFQLIFARRFEEARTAPLDPGNVAAFNQATIELVQPIVEFKHRMGEAQASGQIRSFVWLLFFDHTAREGEHFIQRLAQLSGGDLELDRSEVVEFWTRIMFDHARFIAHLLARTKRRSLRRPATSPGPSGSCTRRRRRPMGIRSSRRRTRSSTSRRRRSRASRRARFGASSIRPWRTTSGARPSSSWTT
jgi:hypothetical protein